MAGDLESMKSDLQTCLGKTPAARVNFCNREHPRKVKVLAHHNLHNEVLNPPHSNTKTQTPPGHEVINNANNLVPHRAKRQQRRGQRLQMPAMPHFRRRPHPTSRRGSDSTETEILDELDAVVLWNLRCGCDAGCWSEVEEEGEMGQGDCGG